jgi:hypothetical protein
VTVAVHPRLLLRRPLLVTVAVHPRPHRPLVTVAAGLALRQVNRAAPDRTANPGSQVALVRMVNLGSQVALVRMVNLGSQVALVRMVNLGSQVALVRMVNLGSQVAPDRTVLRVRRRVSRADRSQMSFDLRI